MKALQLVRFGKVHPFSESIEAFTHLASGRAKGKLVIKIS